MMEWQSTDGLSRPERLRDRQEHRRKEYLGEGGVQGQSKGQKRRRWMEVVRRHREER